MKISTKKDAVENRKKLPTWKEKRPTQVDLINPYNEYFHLALVLV